MTSEIGVYKGKLPNTSTWTHENPDAYRGRPFQRWLSPNHVIGIIAGDITEVVHVPMQLDAQRHIRSVWQSFPDILAWHANPSEKHPYRWNHILFVKTGWAGEVDS